MIDSNTKLIRNKFTEQFVKPPKTADDFPSKPITFDLAKVQDVTFDFQGGSNQFTANQSSDQKALVAPPEVVNFFHNILQPGVAGLPGPNNHGPDVDSRAILQNRNQGGLSTFNSFVSPPYSIDDYIGSLVNGEGVFSNSNNDEVVFHPNNVPLSFIKGCLEFLNENQTTTELYLTLHQGRKNFSGKNDTLSIGTFECDPRVSTAHFGDSNPINDAAQSTTMTFQDKREIRGASIFLKNDPRFLPPFSQLITDQNVSGLMNNQTSTGTQAIINLSNESTKAANAATQGNLAFLYTTNAVFSIVERGKVFEAGPGIPGDTKSRIYNAGGTIFSATEHYPQANATLSVWSRNTITESAGSTLVPSAQILSNNTQNYPGAENNNYHFQLSFLDKGPTIIANINKDSELFDGIGEKGIVLIPDLLEGDIKKNVEFYLRKAGIIERRTIKSPPRPERGR